MKKINTNLNLYQTGDIIAQKYLVVNLLGQGSMGATYEVEELGTYQRLALKAVSLKQTQQWKILELFEREAKVISVLDHPQIPNYIDYFYIDTNEDRVFCLVRELIVGESLASLVKKGWHPSETEVIEIAVQVLTILQYLHQLNPAIIHRDIKPENIIRQNNRDVFLIDFGATQNAYRNRMSMRGTFVGTVGYIPPEQLGGKAYGTSDLYSLGATLLYLLTHRSPDELPIKRMKIDLSRCLNVSEHFRHWIGKMIEPAVEDRFKSASEALKAIAHFQLR